MQHVTYFVTIAVETVHQRHSSPRKISQKALTSMNFWNMQKPL